MHSIGSIIIIETRIMEKTQNVMEKLDQLKSQLTGRKTTTEFVKFQMSIDDAVLYIEAALRVEVEKRGNTFIDSDELQGHIVQIAKMFTEPTIKYGILLCGGVGNGKSSMMYTQAVAMAATACLRTPTHSMR